MDKRIIFPDDNGAVAVVVPSANWLAKEGNSVEKLASMRVPSGKPYLIVDAADIPADREFRNAWTADFTDAKVAP